MGYVVSHILSNLRPHAQRPQLWTCFGRFRHRKKFGTVERTRYSGGNKHKHGTACPREYHQHNTQKHSVIGHIHVCCVWFHVSCVWFLSDHCVHRLLERVGVFSEVKKEGGNLLGKPRMTYGRTHWRGKDFTTYFPSSRMLGEIPPNVPKEDALLSPQ